MIYASGSTQAGLPPTSKPTVCKAEVQNFWKTLNTARSCPMEQACSTPISFRFFAAVVCVFAERLRGCGKTGLLLRSFSLPSMRHVHETNWTGQSSSCVKYPVLDLELFLSSSSFQFGQKEASTHTLSLMSIGSNSFFLNRIPRDFVPCRYRQIFLTALAWLARGLCEYLPHW